MKSNLSTSDKAVRMTVAMMLVILYFTNTLTGVLGKLALVLGGLFMLSGLMSFSLLYAILGISTKK